MLPQSKINSYFGNILHGENSQEACNTEQLAEPNASDRWVAELCMVSWYSTTTLNPCASDAFLDVMFDQDKHRCVCVSVYI